MASPATASAPGVASWEPGTPVGRFTLLTPLAQGGMAEIWLARQSGLKGFEKLVVIKRMMIALEQDPEYVDMFLTEARLAAQLSHPNVVQIYELGEELGSLYIVMEYLDGEDLAVVRRTGQKHGLPLLDSYATKLISMAAEGLHYAHTRTGIDGKALGIVHRDVSPQNLIATFDGGLKVVDFGIAKAASKHTNSGKLKGKLAYMSPEQARGEPLDSRSDIFSLGIVLFEVVTRGRLLPRLNDLELLTIIGGTEPLPRPSDRRADLPPGLEPIILKMMARKREQRFQNAREVHDALEAWLRESNKVVSAGDLADYLRTVFARRIHDRRQLIETAMTTELTPSSARQLSNMVARQSAGTGSSTSHSATRGRDGRRPKGPQVALVALSVLVLAIGGAVFKRMSDAADAERPVVPPPPPLVVEPARPPVLVIDTVPPGASLTVNGQDRGRSPLTLEQLGVGTHQVVASLEGFQSSSKSVALAHPGERVMVELALLPVPPPAVPVATPPPVMGPPKPIAARPPPKRAAPVEAPGKLTLKTTPWTMVYLGKKKLGDTPLLNVPLPAGRHLLRLVNPESNAEDSIEVEIKSNETTVKKLKL
ncbi:MAG: serine/threonine-protein kinase [Archangium sp.]|nr:serine/threonine-protein kinase [Archangium sp.]